MVMILDDWQRDVLATGGNLCLRSGRQSGKSTIISQKGAEFAVRYKKKNILIIASVERQAQLLHEKTLSYLYLNHKGMIKRGKDKPTKHKISLSNGSTIYCLPTGLSGYGIRGYTIDLLIADEAAFIPEEVWTAVTPMLAVTKGDIILLSTPFGKGGYFYRCFSDDNFTSFHVSSEDCPRISKEFLEQERKRMTKVQYAQEYLGEFVDELRQFFPSSLIRKCMTAQRFLDSPSRFSSGRFYLGVDVARMGEDESVLATLQLSQDRLVQKDLIVTEKTLLTDTARLIKLEDSKYNYRKIYIDDGGLGVGVFESLFQDSQTKRKVVGINNASRSISRDNKYKKLLKEDLYNNLLSLMEQGRVSLLDEPNVFDSLRSIQAEPSGGTDPKTGKYMGPQTLKIHGKYSHIAEALIRAAWCVRDKGLNIWIR